MTIRLRMSQSMLETIRRDLSRPHDFAAERVGWLFVESAPAGDGHVLLPIAYEPIEDRDYEPDRRVGARFGGAAIRRALTRAMQHQQGAMLIHAHEFEDWPRFSGVDLETVGALMPAFRGVAPGVFHGAVVIGRENLTAVSGIDGLSDVRCSIIGPVLRVQPGPADRSGRWARQSYLGLHAQRFISNVRVGIVGLGGGGSHIAQLLAFAGFVDYVLPDHDVVTITNLNRTVTAEAVDVESEVLKAEAAARFIRRVLPRATVQILPSRWQDHAEALRSCDVIVSCVDRFTERDQLEVFARRFLIPMIDLGMDVFPAIGGEPPRVVGQVFVSAPDGPCLRCAGIVTEQLLAREAEDYGAAGPAPQVVWSNGMLANAAVGVLVEIVTRWSARRGPWFLSYDGNAVSMQPHPRLPYLPSSCQHFAASNVGLPRLVSR